MIFGGYNHIRYTLQNTCIVWIKHESKILTRVISLEAAAALMWRLGCLTVLVQSKALAKVPTDLKPKRKQCSVSNKVTHC